MDGHLKYGLLMGLYSSALLAMPITVLANTDMPVSYTHLDVYKRQLLMTAVPVYADDIFATAKNAMQTVYTDVAGIATVAAVVCAAVCLFLMNFSKSGRTVDESRSWLKRIVICWAALMTLGAIVTYLEKIIPQSMFTG